MKSQLHKGFVCWMGIKIFKRSILKGVINPLQWDLYLYI